MRTTLTIDPIIAQQLRKRMAAEKLSLKDAVNQTLAAGLAAAKKQEKQKPFKVEPFSLGFRPGIDTSKLNQVLDDLDVEEFAEKYRR